MQNEMLGRVRTAFLKKIAEIAPDSEISLALVISDEPWRAAVEAMREPTEAMLDAADDWLVEDSEQIKSAYGSMIDAALGRVDA